MNISDEEKISLYDYTVHVLEKILINHLKDKNGFDKMFEEKDIANAYLYGLMVAYRNALYMLTRDKKWIKTLDELCEELIKNKKYK